MPEALIEHQQTGTETDVPRNRGAAAEAGARDVIVLKFGSSVIPSERALPGVVEEIQRHVRDGKRVVAVVSAIGGATDSLLAHAKQFGTAESSDHHAHALAAYVATGESQAVALLGLACAWGGLEAEVLDAGAIGLRTRGDPLDSSPTSLDASLLEAALRRAPVVIVPGFVGRDAHGRATLLGRGGSDLTALFIAQHLGARCRLLKDVDGLYDRDPAGPDGLSARRFARIAWDDVLALDEGIVQHKAVRFARSAGLSFEVGLAGAGGGTVVGKETSLA